MQPVVWNSRISGRIPDSEIVPNILSLTTVGGEPAQRAQSVGQPAQRTGEQGGLEQLSGRDMCIFAILTTTCPSDTSTRQV